MSHQTPAKIPALEALARDLIGDAKSPDLFFVSDRGVIVTVTRSYAVAHQQWQQLASRFPKVECALENRTIGVICSVEPESDAIAARLITVDDSKMLRRAP